MKCLLCNVQYDNLFGLQQYFIEKHEVDENNYFFKRLFVKERYVFVWNKCPRCEHYYLNSRDKEKAKSYFIISSEVGVLLNQDQFRLEEWTIN